MADEIIGSLIVNIVGNYASLQTTLAQAQAATRNASATIAASLNSTVSPAFQTASLLVNQFGQAITTTGEVIPKTAQATTQLAQAVNQASAAAAGGTVNIFNMGRAFQSLRPQINQLSEAINGFRRSIIFPLLGINAGINIVTELGKALYGLYTAERDAPEKLQGAFTDLNQDIDATNDSLTVTGDKLDATLARLNSTQRNALKEGLDAAVVSADKLRTALTGAIDTLYKTSAENAPGFVRQTLETMYAGISSFVTGTLSQGIAAATQAATNNAAVGFSAQALGGKTGKGGLRGEEAQAFADLLPKLRDAKTAQESLDAQTAISTRVTAAYNEQIAYQQRLLGTVTPGSEAAEIVQGTIADLQKQLTEKQIQQANAAKEAQVASIEAAREAAQEQASVQLAALDNEIAANKQRAELARTLAGNQIAADHQEREEAIKSIDDKHDRAIAESAEEIQVAASKRDALEKIDQDEFDAYATLLKRKADLVAAGKTPAQASVARAGVAGEGAAAASSLGLNFQALDEGVRSANAQLTETITAEDRKRLDEANKFLDEWTNKFKAAIQAQEEAARRVTEIQEKAAGNQVATGFQSQKIALERQYGLEAIHTGQEQVRYAQQQLALDVADRDAKLAAAHAEARTAEANAARSNSKPADAVDAANKVAAASKLQADNALATQAAQAKIDELLNSQTLQYQLQQDLRNAADALPGQLGNAVASGVFGGGKKGEDVGTQVEKALKNVGKELFGSLITTAIKQLVTQLAATTAVQTVLHAIGIAQTTALTANTAAVVANTAAQATASGGGGIASAIGGLAGFGLFAGGGDPPVGVASIVGERGPELFIPHSAGTIIPAGQFAGGTGSGSLGLPSISGVASSASTNVGEMHFHAHGVTNPKQFTDQIMREIPGKLKSIGGPGFSPLSR